jgi:4-amino-4-deoxy-L-arabinose transferase-like glycosyltransferase
MFSKQSNYHLPLDLFLVVLLGFVIRLFACQNTFIVNPDGVLYIHQARAMYYGQWEDLASCSMSFLSIYPILVAGTYAIFHDWILAARSVSLLFGSMTIIPIYLLLRQFLERPICIASSLMFALIPVFVSRSADVVRGPVAWFFLAFGLYFFVCHMDNKSRVYLLLSSVSYILAAWARVEMVLFILVSVLYVLTSRQPNRITRLIYFVMPVVFVGLICAAGVKIFYTSVNEIFRFGEIGAKFTDVVTGYKILREKLLELSNQPVIGSLELFFQNARHLVWLIALGTLLKFAIRAFFHPFFIIFIVGLSGIGNKIKGDRRLLYLVLLSVSALILLYLHVIQTWVIGNRFIVFFILPSIVFLGFGVKNIIHFFQSRFRLKGSLALLLVCLVVLGFALPKNLKAREEDKLVFKEIGELIAEREGNTQVISIASSLHILRWISFYANLHYPGAPCPQPYSDFKIIIGDRYEYFVNNLKERGFNYFLWEEKHWPVEAFDFLGEINSRDFVGLGSWDHPDTGRLVLFQIT